MNKIQKELIEAKANTASEKAIPYNKKSASVFNDPAAYYDMIKAKRALFVMGYITCAKENKIKFDEE